MADLKFTPMDFSEADRQAWIGGDYTALISSKASSYLKRVLPRKASTRRKRRETDRFFGEAYVSAHVSHESGFYGSFRWLTNSYFLSVPKPISQGPLTDREELHCALWNHFGKAQLHSLHEKARRIEAATGERPGPPDLWLIEQSGQHRFAEVKLPGDSVRACQLAGLAVIAASLRPATGTQVTIEVFDLHPNGLEPKKVDAFRRFLEQAG